MSPKITAIPAARQCGSEPTSLPLRFAAVTSDAQTGPTSALFHFHADPSNPRVPTGCFMMDGSYDPPARRDPTR